MLISPGPGRPSDAGVSKAAIEAFAGRSPVLGVCLGHQCIGEVYGGTVIGAPELMHGKTSEVEHTGVGVFSDLPYAARGDPVPLADRAATPICPTRWR